MKIMTHTRFRGYPEDADPYLHGNGMRVDVISSEAGIQAGGIDMDSRFHGNDMRAKGML